MTSVEEALAVISRLGGKGGGKASKKEIGSIHRCTKRVLVQVTSQNHFVHDTETGSNCLGRSFCCLKAMAPKLTSASTSAQVCTPLLAECPMQYSDEP